MNPSGSCALVLEGENSKPWAGTPYFLSPVYTLSRLASPIQWEGYLVPLASAKRCRGATVIKAPYTRDHNFLVLPLYLELSSYLHQKKIGTISFSVNSG